MRTRVAAAAACAAWVAVMVALTVHHPVPRTDTPPPSPSYVSWKGPTR